MLNKFFIYTVYVARAQPRFDEAIVIVSANQVRYVKNPLTCA